MLQASELILNSDGSVYHLALHPGDVAPIILTVGDPDRVSAVSRHFDRIECRVQKREFVTHTGYLGTRRLTVISTGIGPDNVDIVLNELDALFHVDFASRQPRERGESLTFIRVGTCGGLQPEARVDAPLAACGAFGFDGLMHFYAAPDQHDGPELRALHRHAAGRWRFPAQPYFVSADEALLNAFAGQHLSGYAATHPGFYGPQGRRLRAPVAMPDYLDMLQAFAYEERRIAKLEMETAALYGLARLLGHRALSISAVLANRPLGAFSAEPKKAVEALIVRILEKIDAGGADMR